MFHARTKHIEIQYPIMPRTTLAIMIPTYVAPPNWVPGPYKDLGGWPAREPLAVQECEAAGDVTLTPLSSSVFVRRL